MRIPIVRHLRDWVLNLLSSNGCTDTGDTDQPTNLPINSPTVAMRPLDGRFEHTDTDM